MLVFPGPMCRHLHFPKLNNICHFSDHLTNLSMSSCKFCLSPISLVFDPCYARATVVRARFLAAAFSDGSYLAHVNDAYLRHITFCIVRGPPWSIVSPISQRGPASVRGPLPTNSARLVQSPRRRRWRGWTNVQSNTTCVPYFSIM